MRLICNDFDKHKMVIKFRDGGRPENLGGGGGQVQIGGHNLPLLLEKVLTNLPKFCIPPCGNTRIEYKNNSGLLKPKTEFKFNNK